MGQTNTFASLEALLAPQRIAVIGASRTPGKVGHDILANLIAGGFPGEIIPINPEAESILGLLSYKSVTTYSNNIDLAIIALPAAMTIEAVKAAVNRGVRAIVLVSSGFKEVGENGAGLESQIVKICHAKGVRLLGPNCVGLINTGQKMNASFAGPMPLTGEISIISQSGALCATILDIAAQHKLGLAKVLSIGNKADINEIELLQYLGRDEQTRVIVGYLEDISAGDDFVKAAEDASARKPVVILRSGTTRAGLKAAASHTGVLAVAETAYGAAFQRAGVIRADTFTELFDFATALAFQPLPLGDRVLIITNAGGPGIMAADAVEKAGMQVAALSRDTVNALRRQLPAAASTGNPVDVLGDADPGRYAAVLAAAQEDEGVDAIIVLLTPQIMTRPLEIARTIIKSLKHDKPVLAVFMGGKDVLPGRAELLAAGLPNYDTPERGVAALKAMHYYASWRRRPPRVVTRFAVNRRRVERILTRCLRTGRLNIDEVRAKDILRAYDFLIPQGVLAASQEEAVEIAERIGYPVAMKIVSPDIVHKSDLGGVRLNVANREAVIDAFDLMMLRIRQRAPHAWIEGIYVEKMIDRGLEVIIGMSRDQQFGPMLMFGLGGIFVEVMKDVTFHLAPITSQEAVQMLVATRSYEILQGKRGQKGVDLAAIAGGLQRISQLTTDFPQIAELDINPFIISESGSEAYVADARMTLREERMP